MAWVASELSTKAIAEQLCISPRTVDKHIAQALHKLGVCTRLEAVALEPKPSTDDGITSGRDAW